MVDNIFLFALLIGGTALVFQFVLMLMGLGDDGGDVPSAHGPDVATTGSFDGDFINDSPDWHEAADADLGHPSAHWFYEVISLRTLSAAATFFGLAGKTSLAYGYSTLAASAIAITSGVAAMFIVYWLFKQVYRLQHSGTENIRHAIGRPATVYVPIPGKRSGVGKVMFRMQDRLVEYQAVTEENDRLATGEKTVVVGIVNSDTVCVERVLTPVADMASSV